ncbi:MAG: succinate dehydrogenase cytochrome b subunit [Alphaproteobacteria bacterium]|nr:succinate dehydrogenase cytochrome b subunit [Alphaproteobacteria bacterium]
MTAFFSLAKSTIGKKAIMAGSGLIMVGWIVLHMAGNLLVFAGQDHFNAYAEMIQSGFHIEPALLWAMRITLLACVGLHIWAAVGLSGRNRAARPVAYAGGRKNHATSYAAEFMLGAGVVLLLYLVFHLLHLTVGVFSDDVVQHAAFSKKDAYRNLVVGVGNPVVGAFYVLANLALGMHLHHGIKSAFQTLGLNDDRWNPLKDALTRWVPVFTTGAALLVALSCMFGVGVLIEAPDLSWTPSH